MHTWQYLLDTETNELKNVTTDPPTVNAHGCVVYRDALYVVTDGGPDGTGALVRIDPETWEMEVLLNNYYQQPFMGFNDLDIDSDGNFWMTDSKSGAVSDHYIYLRGRIRTDSSNARAETSSPSTRPQTPQCTW